MLGNNMVSIISRPKNNVVYYYLNYHSGTVQREKYLGKSIPSNISEIKEEFQQEIFSNTWDKVIKKIFRDHHKKIKFFTGSTSIKNLESFGAAFTFHSQRISGCSLNRTDTENLLLSGLTPNKKSKFDSIETQKHYDLFIDLFLSDIPGRITKDVLVYWHHSLFGQTKIDEAGIVRTNTKSMKKLPDNFIPGPKVLKKLREFFIWFNKYDDTKNVVQFAALACQKLESIHPFIDGNGRISRLLMNYVLHSHGYPLLLVKNSDKKLYFEAIRKSQINNDYFIFLKWFMKYYVQNNPI